MSNINNIKMAIIFPSSMKENFSILLSSLDEFLPEFHESNHVLSLDYDGKSVIFSIIEQNVKKRNVLAGSFSFLASKISDQYYHENYQKEEKIATIVKSLKTLIEFKVKKIIKNN